MSTPQQAGAAVSTPQTAPAGVSDIPVVGPLLDTGSAVATGLGNLSSFLAWITDPHNIVRVVFVLGGVAGVVVGLRIVADSGIGGPVGAAAGGVKRASDAATAGVKLATQAGAAVATDGASVVATGAAKAGKAAAGAAKAAKA